MATSSILENIRVNNPKVIEEYVTALEASENAEMSPRRTPIAKQEHDPDVLKVIMQKGIEKWGTV